MSESICYRVHLPDSLAANPLLLAQLATEDRPCQLHGTARVITVGNTGLLAATGRARTTSADQCSFAQDATTILQPLTLAMACHQLLIALTALLGWNKNPILGRNRTDGPLPRRKVARGKSSEKYKSCRMATQRLGRYVADGQDVDDRAGGTI